jgi:hypothetical protein
MMVSLILYKSILLAVALGLEIHTLQLVLNESVSRESLLAALFIHFGASFIAAFALPKSIMPGLVEERWRLISLDFFIYLCWD